MSRHIGDRAYGMLAGAALAALLAFPTGAAAQLSSTSTRGTSTQSMFGSRSLGGSTQSNIQRAGGGATGTSLGAGFTTGLTTGGTAMGAGAANQQQQRGFVGADSSDAVNLRSFQGTGGLTGGGRSNQFSSLGGRGGQQSPFGGLQSLFSGRGGLSGLFGGQSNSSRNGRSQTQLRIPLRLGFEPRVVETPRAAAVFSQRLTKLPGLNRVGPIEVTLEGTTAVLRGTVASESDRELAEGLARLEPAVQEVRNELLVSAPASSLEALPPATP